MSVVHLQTVWEYRKDVPVMFVLRNIDGVRRHLLVKSTNGPRMIMERSLACNPFVIGKLFRYIYPFRAAGGLKLSLTGDSGLIPVKPLIVWHYPGPRDPMIVSTNTEIWFWGYQPYPPPQDIRERQKRCLSVPSQCIAHHTY
jgi:hypothetical protein